MIKRGPSAKKKTNNITKQHKYKQQQLQATTVTEVCAGVRYARPARREVDVPSGFCSSEFVYIYIYIYSMI